MKSIETKKVKTVNGKTLIVTVDISKATNVGYCRCPDGTDTNHLNLIIMDKALIIFGAESSR